MEQEVILVNDKDEQTGTMAKLPAHREGLLHRAFSVFIMNSRGEMLLQQRSPGKYHSPGLWTNACCSHPAPGEDTASAARRRLREELRFETDLSEIFHFTYRSSFDNGLTEHEFDHVFLGLYDGPLQPDPAEVSNHCFATPEQIETSLKEQPEKFTSWFHIAFPMVQQWLKEHSNAPHPAP